MMPTTAFKPSPTITRGVSFYSYQEEYFTRSMTLEDCIAEVASMGATGVQLVSEQMIPNYPDPPAEWVDSWFAMMDQYGTIPTVLDTYWDFNFGGHRDVDLDEALETFATQIRLAHRLGFKVVRPTEGSPRRFKAVDLFERALPIAEELDIRVAPEVHSPAALSGGKLETYLEMITRTGTKHFGITLDLSVFTRRYPRIARDRQIRDGVLDERIAVYITDAHEAGAGRDDTASAVRAMGAKDTDLRFVDTVFNPALMQDPRDLAALTPYIFNVHAKVLEMTEALEEYSIAYDIAVPALMQAGYAGSIDTEYEGQRHIQDVEIVDSCEQVRRNQVQLRRLLGEI